MRIAFLGTPEFAVASLNACIEYGEVVCVITQPDRKRGRGKKLLPTIVKKEALKHNIEVFQPKNIKTEESIEKLKSLNLDLMVVVAYGQILSKEVLEIPTHGCINVHASLLPKLRGAAPTNWAIVRGHSVSGVTIMQMDEGLDTGDMLAKDDIVITDDMTAGQLHDNLKEMGARLLQKTLKDIENGTLLPVKQKEEESTYAPMMDKKMAAIEWDNKAWEIHNLIRGFNPWPVAYTMYKNQRMKIYQSTVVDQRSHKKPGTILEVSSEGILVATKEKALRITKVQFPNKRKMNVSDYILGNDIEKDYILGE